MARPGIKDQEHAGKVVNEVWDSCLRDISIMRTSERCDWSVRTMYYNGCTTLVRAHSDGVDKGAGIFRYTRGRGVV